MVRGAGFIRKFPDPTHSRGGQLSAKSLVSSERKSVTQGMISLSEPENLSRNSDKSSSQKITGTYQAVNKYLADSLQ